MKVILREDVYNLGKSGELVSVKEGYARNYLLPRNLAMLASNANVRQLEHEKQVIELRQQKLAFRRHVLHQAILKRREKFADKVRVGLG
jgi:ribosomal protein L9